ncbi:hypothetical protein DICPUDRAFT_81614 [Dictyostelium purpureum]|uniref:PARP catalytic domain-containing protein n=1 Tax=Dictyostelium purpureum TaxID=5786 RepID=F0ZU17_DICPU|nr:uncharacterized protein DICPUDRAFT_81614 [Dictyostelium purpureum]EGC32566.1 hypothetical protein DICPUDRAFT_81614 [Dictyostelium purpureum]|eukprot:XP_003290903.1 hypothetical protein DICPUDRAFT_81614 [Dictyostelium purpureum]
MYRLKIKYFNGEFLYNDQDPIKNIDDLKLFIKKKLFISEEHQIIQCEQSLLDSFFKGLICSIYFELYTNFIFTKFIGYNGTCNLESFFSNEFNKSSSELGFMKFALNVNKHEDRSWLSDWHVTYHGTSLSNAISIIQQGYLLSKCIIPGIYSSNKLQTALGYCKKDPSQTQYSVILKNRVDPRYFKGSEVYVADNESLIRPYAILIKKN